MINVSIHVDADDLAAGRARLQRFDRLDVRKTLIDAGQAGLINCLRSHFAQREREPHQNTGFPAFGQSFPKRYFWRGTRGNSVAEKLRVVYSSPDRLEAHIAIDSPALAHKLAPNPPDIRPTGGRKYLAVPANPAAAGWTGRPKDFPGGLRFGYTYVPNLEHWLPALFAARNYKNKSGKASAKDGKSGQNDLVYYLIRHAKTRHDPRALPADDVALSAVQSAVARALATLNL